MVRLASKMELARYYWSLKSQPLCSYFLLTYFEITRYINLTQNSIYYMKFVPDYFYLKFVYSSIPKKMSRIWLNLILHQIVCRYIKI
jgi:hypothetical protein